MVCRTAGNDINSLKTCQHLTSKPDFREIDLTVLYIGANRILHGFGLFMDLLKHKMLISAFLCGFCIPLDLYHILMDLFAVNIIEVDLILTKFRDLHVSDIVNISCSVQDS